MKALKLFALFALAAVSAAPLLRAEDKAPDGPPPAEGKGPRKGGRMNPEQMIARIDETVGGLTADQKAKLKDIVTANMAKAKDAAPEDRRSIMEAQREQIRAVLTDEQKKKFDEMRPPGPGERARGKKKEQ